MKSFFSPLILITVIAIQGVALQGVSPQIANPSGPPDNLVGRWRVTFAVSGIGVKHLVFKSLAKGSGSFLLLDAGPDNKAATASLPAVWAPAGNDRVSFSGEVELPIGTCCRETGTLVFKGKFDSSKSITGKVVFIGSTEDPENFNGFRSMAGTFTATRVPN